MADIVGLEPTTCSLTANRSTIELDVNINYLISSNILFLIESNFP